MASPGDELDRNVDHGPDRAVEVARDCVERAIGRVESIKALTGGIMNRAFAVTAAGAPPLVVRVAERGRRHFEEERAALEGLVAHDLPVPRVLALDHLGEGAGVVSVIIISMLPGRPMGTREQLDPTAAKETVVELGGLLARIHGATLEATDNEHPGWLAGRLDDIGWMHEGAALAGVDIGIVDSAADVVRSSSRPVGPRAVVHNDFKSGNILIDRGHVTGVIDFEFASLTDPARDLAFWTFWHGSAAGALLMEGYESGNDIVVTSIEDRVNLYRIEIALSYLEWFRHRRLWPGAAQLVTRNLLEASAAIG